MSSKAEDHPSSLTDRTGKHEHTKNNLHAIPGMELWTDGLICAFEYVKGHRKVHKPKHHSTLHPSSHAPYEQIQNGIKQLEPPVAVLEPDHVSHIEEHLSNQTQLQQPQPEQFPDSTWVPIGWSRIAELVQTVEANAEWSSLQMEFSGDIDDVAVADLAAPYWARPSGPVWWCHVDAGSSNISSWLKNAQWLHPAVRIALRDESRLISEKMKYLYYEVPVRVAGGLLFELLGQSAGDPFVDGDDIPIVLRSWQAQNFLITAMHVKGSMSNLNVLGVVEVQELLAGGGYNAPRSIHEVIALLACRLARWDDRLFRKTILGAADEIELKFVNRRTQEDMHLFGVILNQEVRKLSREVIRVKWSLHAREEIVFELIQHLRGNNTKYLLEEIRKGTRQMMEEQEAARSRLFTVQDVMQSTVRAWLQDQSLRVTHNLGVIGGCGLVLTVVTGLFGINVDGIPGAENTPYAFALFTGLLVLVGAILIGVGLLYFGLKRPISEEQVKVRKLELDQLVKMFQHEAETHAQVRETSHRSKFPTSDPTNFANGFPHDADYVIIQ